MPRFQTFSWQRKDHLEQPAVGAKVDKSDEYVDRMQAYLTGPRDLRRHSKWPKALRMQGSVTHKLIIPLIGITLWAGMIATFSFKVQMISVHPTVITVLGLVVGLALNLRSQTAYERYMEGARMWAALGAVATSLARHIWLNVKEPEGENAMAVLIEKTAALNLVAGFVIALKHRLRFEPYIHYDDLNPLVAHLDTFARAAGEHEASAPKFMRKRLGTILHIPMARSNPREQIKQAKRPVGNLPLEILSHISAYLTAQFDTGNFHLGIAQNQAMNNMHDLHTILATTDRVLNTPLPLAYQIAISQITWLYMLTLPFQLVGVTGWLSIPITLVAGYIVLSILYIGNEIENPFGLEVNDLPLEDYCDQIVNDVNVIAAISTKNMEAEIQSPYSKLLYPFSLASREFWATRTEDDIRHGLKLRADSTKTTMWERLNSWRADDNNYPSRGRTESGTVYGDCENGLCKAKHGEQSPKNTHDHWPKDHRGYGSYGHSEMTAVSASCEKGAGPSRNEEHSPGHGNDEGPQVNERLEDYIRDHYVPPRAQTTRVRKAGFVWEGGD